MLTPSTLRRLLMHTLTLQITRRRQLLLPLTISPLDPDAVQFLVNLLSSLLPFLNLTQPFSKFSQLLLNIRLFALGADALELPFVTVIAYAEGECVGMVAF
jgi:hypothetical protein